MSGDRRDKNLPTHATRLGAQDKIFTARRKVDELSMYGKTVFMVGYKKAIDVLTHNLPTDEKTRTEVLLTTMLSELYDKRTDYNEFKDVINKHKKANPLMERPINEMVNTLYLS